jgi:hypothetical protein
VPGPQANPWGDEPGGNAEADEDADRDDQ